MNTITENTSATKQIYNTFIQDNSLELFKEIVVQIKMKSNKKGLSADEHLLYNLIRGLPLDRGFSTPKKEITFGFIKAKKDLKYLLKYHASKGYFEKMSPETIQNYLVALEN